MARTLPPPTYVVEMGDEHWRLIRTDGPRLVLGVHGTQKDARLQGYVHARIARGWLTVHDEDGAPCEFVDYTD